jgi:haloacetate dehalogenase
MFESFENAVVDVGASTIAISRGGAGPPVLLLHGFPQTRVMWHRVAGELARHCTVICADLRGYGASGTPPSTPDHAPYAKAAMAADMVALMDRLGWQKFALVGHDRGGRVAHRLVLDHAARVTRVAVLDIVPTRTMFEQITQRGALGYYHWFFLAQPHDLPERLIAADPVFWLRWHLRAWSGGEDAFFAVDVLAEYERCFADPACIHATCEDYRAGATIDLRHDEHDLELRLGCPLLVLWGERSGTTPAFNVLAAWRERATSVDGRPLDCGHFLAEERPDDVARELLSFLGTGL